MQEVRFAEEFACVFIATSLDRENRSKGKADHRDGDGQIHAPFPP
jgi:hypothetical protein